MRRPHHQFRLILSVCVLLNCALVFGAAASNDLKSGRIVSSDRARPYQLHIGDDLEVKFFYSPELDQKVSVRPDGKISLPLATNVQAEGLTAEELAGVLRGIYEKELVAPEISVVVRQFSAQKIFVNGEVSRPGVLELNGIKTVLQAISEAGGLKDSARAKEVLLIRQNANHQIAVIKVDVDQLLRGKPQAEDHLLEPYDIIYVPRSRIANVNYWVDAYVRKNIPGSFGMMMVP
jgi:polysaccharide biosynthesis/export protein